MSLMYPPDTCNLAKWPATAASLDSRSTQQMFTEFCSVLVKFVSGHPKAQWNKCMKQRDSLLTLQHLLIRNHALDRHKPYPTRCVLHRDFTSTKANWNACAIQTFIQIYAHRCTHLWFDHLYASKSYHPHHLLKKLLHPRHHPPIVISYASIIYEKLIEILNYHSFTCELYNLFIYMYLFVPCNTRINKHFQIKSNWDITCTITDMVLISFRRFHFPSNFMRLEMQYFCYKVNM